MVVVHIDEAGVCWSQQHGKKAQKKNEPKRERKAKK